MKDNGMPRLEIAPTEVPLTVMYDEYFLSDDEEKAHEYLMRRRNVTLATLLGDSLEEDLSENERKTIKAYWFERRSVGDLAFEYGVTERSVRYTLERANKKLQHCLRHAVKYQYDMENIVFLPTAVMRAMSVYAARKGAVNDICDIVKNVRISRDISQKRMADDLEISLSYLNDIEQGRKFPTSELLTKIAAYFSISIEFTIKDEGGVYRWREL